MLLDDLERRLRRGLGVPWVFGGLLAALAGLAVAVRWGRLPVAWSSWAVDYVSYSHPHAEALRGGVLPWTLPVGNHPGQFALLYAVLLEAGASFRDLYWIPVLASVGALVAGSLWLRAVASPVAGLFFAVILAFGPYQAHYGMELNNYPLYLLAGALVTIATHGAWTAASPLRLAALAAATALAVHTHFFILPLLGAAGLAALASRRWAMVAALMLGGATGLPLAHKAMSLLGAHSTYVNGPSAGSGLGTLWLAWCERFGGWPLVGAMVLLLGVLGAAALRDRAVRRAAIWPAAGLGVGVPFLVVIYLTGGAATHQLPHWVLLSWFASALIAMGLATRLRHPAAWFTRPFLLLIWLGPGGARALHPCSVGPGEGGEPPPEALLAYLDEQIDADDVLVYLWFPVYTNDLPHRWDPAIAAVDPGDVGTWVAGDPCGRFAFEYREGRICFGNDSSLDSGYGQLLQGYVHTWLAEDLTVHLWFANPSDTPPDPGPLQGTAVSLEVTPFDQHHVVRVARSGHSRP
jgi:hypothetical protein